MAESSIQGIVKTMLQARGNLKVDAVTKDKTQEKISFMELMSQNGISAGAETFIGSKDTEPAVNDTDAAKTAYDSTTGSLQKNVSVKQDVTAKEKYAEASEELTQYEEEIRNVLKEELGVTDEQLEEAMQLLGLSFLDLTNRQNLTALVQSLTGVDVGTLFLSESFQNVVEQVTVLTEQLCEQLGVTPEEFEALSGEWKQMMTPEGDMPKEAEAAETVMDPMPEENVIQQETAEHTAADTAQKTDVSQDNAAQAAMGELTEEAQTDVEKSTEAEPKEGLPEELKQSEEVRQPEETDGETSREQTADQGKQELSDNSHRLGAEKTGNEAAFAGTQTIRSGEFAVTEEITQPYANPVDVSEVIEQIVRNARITITAGTTSMEMQLNPENLGKIYLSVTEREGVIRAQLAASNETVKEALETQLVELRQAMNQQGIKVDAIEVTVAAHEFEQNLEGNTKQEEQMQQQMEESKKQMTRNRNLNLNDLDGLSGLMTEEEQLAAQIMKDNGNQVDLTA